MDNTDKKKIIIKSVRENNLKKEPKYKLNKIIFDFSEILFDFLFAK